MFRKFEKITIRSIVRVASVAWTLTMEMSGKFLFHQMCVNIFVYFHCHTYYKKIPKQHKLGPVVES